MRTLNPNTLERVENYITEYQRKRLGTRRGFIAVKPNCSIQSYTPALAAWKEFEPLSPLKRKLSF